MAVYEYETASGPVSAQYQVLSSNRNGGYIEKFMGDRGTLVMSQGDYLTKIYPELMNSKVEDWAGFIKEGRLSGPDEIMDRIDELTISQLAKLLIVKETPPSWRLRDRSFELPVEMKKLFHQPHLENFFDAIRGRATLNCPAEVGYKTAVAVLKVNEAVEAERKLEFQPDEFAV